MATKTTKKNASPAKAASKSPAKKSSPSKKKSSTSKSSRNNMILFLLVALVVGMLIWVLNRSNGTTPATTPSGKSSMILESSTSSVAVGDKIHVKLFSDSKDVRNNAVQAVVKYPKNNLQLVKVNSDSSAYPIKAEETTSEGTVKVSRGVIGGVINKQLVTDMEFVAKAAGKAEISYDKSETFLVSAETNKNILSSGGYETTTVEVIK